MGCHFCADELFAILAVIGGVRFIPGWVRAMWARRHRKDNCCHGDDYIDKTLDRRIRHGKFKGQA